MKKNYDYIYVHIVEKNILNIEYEHIYREIIQKNEKILIQIFDIKIEQE